MVFMQKPSGLLMPRVLEKNPLLKKEIREILCKIYVYYTSRKYQELCRNTEIEIKTAISSEYIDRVMKTFVDNNKEFQQLCDKGIKGLQVVMRVDRSDPFTDPENDLLNELLEDVEDLKTWGEFKLFAEAKDAKAELKRRTGRTKARQGK